ncbi:pentapeptide repeat-containing protein [Mesorhizobium sp. BR1-1-13]|uniref:pentapeptide repeat-containing protein n=1 Tax=Mesorhizobium sp. BR1-1-13 TaxID=2876656 RepID=UPI001CD056C1|nr:pentapeptide repeat-containing protein [Mesorhizobium sp. BR1-1-13]MBZ9940154.1 pentapeptide repeat-containing protein [Mesorhizobium sp. BR1-1-13]
MRTEETFLSGILSEDALGRLAKLASAEHSTFSEQVKIAGLNIEKDLQHADLCGIDISRSDLRGFNLTGADLRGITGIEFEVDSSTVLDGADLEGSVLALQVRLDNFFAKNESAARALKNLQRASIVGQLEWAARNLQPSGKYHQIAIPVVEGLLRRSSDNFLKSEFLRYLAPRMGTRAEMKEMLLASIADNPDNAIIVGNAMQLFKRYGMAKDPTLRRMAFALLDSANVGIKGAVLHFLMRNGTTKDEFEFIRSKAYVDKLLGQLFVAKVAAGLGEEYELVTRDPITNQTFAPDAVVRAPTLLLIARRWLRLDWGPDRSDDNVPLLQKRISLHSSWPPDVVERRVADVEELFRQLRTEGIGFDWEALSSANESGRVHVPVAN